MAGTNDELWPAGSGDEFKADIRAVMEMGMPNDPAQRPTFHFNPHRVFPEADTAGLPFDWTEDPDVDEPKDDVQVLCTTEPITGLGAGSTVNETPSGSLSGGRVKLYFFAEEWALVEDFTSVTISGVDYTRIRKEPVTALFDVDTYSVEVRADDA